MRFGAVHSGLSGGLFWSHIKPGRVEPSGGKCLHDGSLDQQAAAGHIDQNAARFQLGHCGGIDQSAGLRGERCGQKNQVGLGEQPQEFVRPRQLIEPSGWLVRKIVGGQQAGFPGPENLGEPPSVAAKANNQRSCSRQIPGRLPDELPSVLLGEEQRNPAGAGGCQGKGLFGHLIGEHARRARHQHVRFNHAGNKAVIEPSRR